MSNLNSSASQSVTPSQIVRPDTVIRLTCYRGTEAADVGRFVQAWQQMVETGPRKGVLYRELNRQVLEWSQQAAAEMDNPIESAFLEYLVMEPETDTSGIPAMPEGASGEWSMTHDLHTVAFRLTKEQAEPWTGALMFNLFEIDGPPGMEQGFLMDWPPRGQFKINEAATISTMLHQRTPGPATYKAFNRAEITSAADYSEGIARFEAAFPRRARKAAAESLASAAKPPIRSHLGLFERVALGPVQETDGAERSSMLAVVIEEFGSPEVLLVRSVPRPEPGPGQVRVRVKAASINPLDVKMRSGEVRGIYPSWFPDILGYSVAGIIDAVGLGVTERTIGEEVYGINNPIMRHGYAEYVVGPASFFYPKPSRMDFPTAAAAPSIFATAYGGLFLRTNLQAGQTILIHGGAGVIGSCAVQLAHQACARVIATASGKNVERVRSLGADIVVDYKSQRFEEFAQGVDAVLDTVGGETRDRSWPLIRKGGVLASLLPPPPEPEKAATFGIRAFMVHGHPNVGEIMPEMTSRLEVGELAFPEVAATYPLAKASEAHAAFERSAPRGRLVLTVD